MPGQFSLGADLPLAHGKAANTGPVMISPGFLKNSHLSIRTVTSSDALEVFRALPSESKTCRAGASVVTIARAGTSDRVQSSTCDSQSEMWAVLDNAQSAIKSALRFPGEIALRNKASSQLNKIRRFETRWIRVA